jgi:REP element-mobilizing transposase RayT
MSRKARERSNSGIYHTILRGINRQSIFEDDDDRQKLIETLSRYKEVSDYRIFAYCVMDNHVHVLLQEVKEPIGMIIKRISSSYVFWYNSKHKRCGHLFQERFKSEAVETDSYLLTVLRYIHQNPVKARLVNDISEYKWSSYNEYIGGSQIVDSEFALKLFSKIPEEAVKRFEKYSREESVDSCLEIKENRVIMSDDKLREIVNRQLGIEAIKVCSETRERQDSIVRKLKEIDGVNIRQIARITGLSQTRVWRA